MRKTESHAQGPMTLSGAPVGSRPSLLLTQLLSAPLPLGIIMNSKGPKILCLVEQPSLHETPCQSHWAIGAENRCSPPHTALLLQASERRPVCHEAVLEGWLGMQQEPKRSSPRG
jgi:hypothetical protein